MYPPEDSSDQSSELLLAELIREQVLNRTRRGDPALGRGRRSRRSTPPRGRPGHRRGRDLGRDRVPEGDPDRQGRRQGRRDRHRRPALARSASWAPGSTSTSRSACAATGAATRTCSTGSASSRRRRGHYDWPMFGEIEFDERGLVPCVAQDWASGEVLTLAYMSEEALRLTRRDRRAALLQPLARARSGTRARPRATSMRLRQLRYDCDGDALVALVEPAGPACHTGERSCFYREVRRRGVDRQGRAAGAGRARPGRPRGAAGARADAAQPRGRAPRGQLHRRAARRSAS